MSRGMRRAAPRHKYHAKPDTRDGQRFDSKKEARYYDGLIVRQKAGEIVFFLRQLPFHLPGGVTYRCDFAEFHADGTVHFVDVKGMATADFRAKKRMVEARYPVVIEVF